MKMLPMVVWLDMNPSVFPVWFASPLTRLPPISEPSITTLPSACPLIEPAWPSLDEEPAEPPTTFPITVTFWIVPFEST